MPEEFFAPARATVTVSELNQTIKSLLDGEPSLRGVYVKGEISNFTNHRSGHLYFSLKDEGGLIRAVMFRSSAGTLNFLPENGMKVIAHGSVTSYARDGQYQLYVTSMEPDGIGALYLAYEQLKRKLESEGLFDPSRKRPLPKIPSSIGVITSATGAAVRDVINILGRRFPYAEMILYPSLVQGDGAAPELCRGVRYFNEQRPVDVIIIGRGGGSIEDLWAFNDETLARTVAASRIPVISAVGHETDFTICDFAADHRAPTPSAAAELAVPDTAELMQKFRNVIPVMSKFLTRSVAGYRQKLDYLSKSAVFEYPERLFDDRRVNVDRTADEMLHAYETRVANARLALAKTGASLNALSPLSILSRGYAVASGADGGAIRSVSSIGQGDALDVRLSDGVVHTTVNSTEKS